VSVVVAVESVCIEVLGLVVAPVVDEYSIEFGADYKQVDDKLVVDNIPEMKPKLTFY